MKIEPKDFSEYIPHESIGLFDLPFADYRADAGINASALKDISRSMRYWEAKKRQPDEPTRDMILGQILHKSVLESRDFGAGKSHYIRPDTYIAERLQCPQCESIGTGKKCSKCKVERVPVGVEQDWNGNSKTCQQWLLEHADKPIISPDDAECAALMRQAILDDEMAGDFIKAAWCEVSAFCVDPSTGERLKARFDMLALSKEGVVVGDLKKTQDADNKHAVARYFVQRQVHLQLAYYGHILETLGQKDIRTLAGMIEDSISPELVWWELDDDDRSAGGGAWRKALKRYHDSKSAKTMPGYDKSEPIRKLKLPRWALNQE